jgi:hypothetical protein
MRRLAAFFASLFVIAALGAPVVLAADSELSHSGRVLMAFGGDMTVPAGEQADVVFVADGDALVSGQVNTVVVIEGTATLRDATVESVVTVNATVNLEGSTVVLGDVRAIGSTVHRAETATLDGAIKGLDAELLMVGAVLVPALFLLALGFALATIVAGLLLVAIGSRQVRAAERLIVHEPGWVFVVGLLVAIVSPILAIIAIVTVVGAPLGMGVLIAVLPALAFVGYLVSGIVLGERILGTGTATEPVQRPYKAALVGIIVLQVIGLIPFLGGLATAAASLFGLGAIVLLAWRTMRGAGTGQPLPTNAPLPIGA